MTPDSTDRISPYSLSSLSQHISISDRPDITPETRPPPGVVPGQLPQAYYGGGAPFYPPQQASGPPPQASGGVVAPPQQQAEQQNHVYK
ncbi:hypothetical protein AtubIFM55763_007972 [Aspergillus tubingensis]|nr:hypothetical protein AtubIFM55763_007972 [Aspergillus tubingensis]